MVHMHMVQVKFEMLFNSVLSSRYCHRYTLVLGRTQVCTLFTWSILVDLEVVFYSVVNALCKSTAANS